MSVPTYAARLSHVPDKGVVGLPELRDADRTKKTKFRKLAKFLKEAKTVVCLTGAGISTSAGIADFRGPNGVWTKEKTEKDKGSRRSKRPKLTAQVLEAADDSFESAKPTRTHEVLTSLRKVGFVSLIVSQNVDGLHLKSGFPRADLIELHGNVFMERCASCEHEIVHERDVGGIGCKPTGKSCPKCPKGRMHDTVLDWDTPLSDEDLARAETAIAEADLVLCLGTSLRIVPAAELPLLVGTKRSDDIEPRICIVNLQATPLDSQADLVIHRPVDEVMAFIAETILEKA